MCFDNRMNINYNNNDNICLDNIVVVGTTTKPQEVDPGLRRPGRLGVEFFIKVR